MKIHMNETFKVTTYEDSMEWENGYRVYIQRVRKDKDEWSIPFVSFSNSSGDKLHFNDSLSINIDDYYGSADTLIDMIRYARKHGWTKKEEIK